MKKTELKNCDLKETSQPNLYKCPFFLDQCQSAYLFYRSNHGWYYTRRKGKKKTSSLYDLNILRLDKWISIHPNKPLEENYTLLLSNIEHRHKLIITLLQIIRINV